MRPRRLLVVGAVPGSLGEAIQAEAPHAGFEVHCAGIRGEAIELDALHMPMQTMLDIMMSLRPSHVVSTIGLNMPRPMVPDVFEWYRWHYETNVVAVMRLFDAWRTAEFTTEPEQVGHFVAISSNSARIPRSSSGAYCASKAALSMALRVAAREAKGGDRGYIVYGYEPGLLAGTPMTQRVEERFGSAMPLTRMRGRAVEKGIPPEELARLIVSNLRLPGAALNGALIPFDADEL